jgi:hypothetical protein
MNVCCGQSCSCEGGGAIKARVLKLSSEFQDEFVVFRGIDLQVVATFPAKQTDTEVLRELTEA